MAGLTGSTVDNLTVQGLHGGAQQLQVGREGGGQRGEEGERRKGGWL